MKKSIKEGSMSDVDLMAKEASSFKEFVKEFYKEFRDFPKTREAMKWLEDTYKSVSEGTESDELERVADGLPQTVEEMINEISLSSAGVRDFLRALYRNNNILKKLGFSNFKGAVDYIRSNGGRDWDELRDEATGFGLKFESVNEALGNDKSMLALVDILSNSMEHYDEKDFLQTIRGGQGWSGIAGFQNSSLIPIFKSIYKKYWTVSPKNRTNWSSKDWIKWLKPFGLEESINKEEVTEGDGLWANIRAKRARGEKPAHGNSDAHKDAVAAGKKINKEESVTEEAGCGCGCNTCGGSNLTENTEPTIISQLKDIVKHNQNKVLVDPKSGKKMRVDLYSASAITQVYDAFKQQSNKDKFVGSGLIAMQSIAMKLLK
jgi:hypothetical protein